MPFTTPINNNSLSVHKTPGKNKRLLNSNSKAIFTFGDFKIERNKSFNYLSANTNNLSFDGFSTLNSLGATDLQTNNLEFSVGESELNHKSENPKSHVYFSSFYTNVATSINNIIKNYPYSILSTTNGNSINIFNYVEDFNSNTGNTSSFSLKQENLINQGEIMLNSGNSLNKISLVNDFAKYTIQLSGETKEHKILNYTYNSSSNTLNFKIEGELLLDNSLTERSIYIKPSIKDVIFFKQNLTSLENQLIGSGKLMIPDMSEDTSYLQQFKWPKTIDGIAPDSYGAAFNTYKNQILDAAEKIDEEKTNIFLKTIIPENYLEYDSTGQIYRTLIQTYAYEFDSLKKYVDAIAYAHSIDYTKENNVPDKFLPKLSRLLGWKLSSSFNEIDLFDYLTTDNTEEVNSLAEFNIEIWKRILTNITWLYKKKGTRDALMFIFKILGAPECLVNFNEFVYNIERVITDVTPNTISPVTSSLDAQLVEFQSSEPTELSSETTTLDKINEYGFINYNMSQYHFQADGNGRGNGQAYINQWRPEFNPIIKQDNIKVQIGDSDLNIGTKSIINTKEVNLSYEPSKVVECAVFDYYKNLSGMCEIWLWGSPSTEGSASASTLYCPNIVGGSGLTFSSLTGMTFDEYNNIYSATEINDPAIISAMTLNQYIDYLFANAVNPRDRKTNSQNHTSWHYPELRNIYLTYYSYSNPQLTVGKLEAYLDLLGASLGDYIEQTIPATTIIKGNGSIVYKNPLFHRQKFIYKDGIDKGSTFQNNLPVDPHPLIISSIQNLSVNKNGYKTNIISTDISAKCSPNINANMLTVDLNYVIHKTVNSDNNIFSISMTVGNTLDANLDSWSTKGTIGDEQTVLINQQELEN